MKKNSMAQKRKKPVSDVTEVQPGSLQLRRLAAGTNSDTSAEAALTLVQLILTSTKLIK
jgi:hypothetical protein